MPRVTHVKRAQQRYATVPVLDDDGNPKRVPVIGKTGKQKTTKTGKLVTMAVTREDRTQPKDPYTCDFCRQTIEIGTPYKHITPKSGPYGGTRRTRHEDCPNWQVWEYSSSLSARLAQVSHGFWQAIDAVESEDDVQSALDDAAEEIKGIAEEKREGASNIEEGFGHPTSASEELEQTADSLDEWAEEITGADIPEFPEPEERWFVTGGNNGSTGEPSAEFEEDGYDDESEAEHALAMYREDNGTNGDGDDDDDGFEIENLTPDEPTADQIDAWRDEVRDALTIVDESPV